MGLRYRSDGLIIGDVGDDKTINIDDVVKSFDCYIGNIDCYTLYGKRETQFDPLGG